MVAGEPAQVPTGVKEVVARFGRVEAMVLLDSSGEPLLVRPCATPMRWAAALTLWARPRRAIIVVSGKHQAPDAWTPEPGAPRRSFGASAG